MAKVYMRSRSLGRDCNWAFIIKRDILAGWMVSVAWAIGVSFLVRLKRTAAIAPYTEQPKNETTLLPEESEEKS
ncbi:hypothetical protein H6G17_18315 [Chroococcidiopsis sp. FACHB-1243]|uniref:hypothetical protein n=1 Tax=Chroococcidiopsis sp. [FACHB-1243] TaxID=2692781 RepID=UPI00177AEA5E|nr:hypothetical protein [Chroococcidiopsis sp. [FACHB-1243]]MBD2307432.1 hypothetical protein [Chroococcidiopsis sp. [FACHB-1243]]